MPFLNPQCLVGIRTSAKSVGKGTKNFRDSFHFPSPFYNLGEIGNSDYEYYIDENGVRRRKRRGMRR